MLPEKTGFLRATFLIILLLAPYSLAQLAPQQVRYNDDNSATGEIFVSPANPLTALFIVMVAVVAALVLIRVRRNRAEGASPDFMPVHPPEYKEK